MYCSTSISLTMLVSCRLHLVQSPGSPDSLIEPGAWSRSDQSFLTRHRGIVGRTCWAWYSPSSWAASVP